MSENRRIDALLEEAHKLGMAEVERRARAIMERHPAVQGFCMAMGSASFHMRNGDSVDGFYETRAYTERFFDFVGEYDQYLCLTGTPLRLDRVDGQIVKKTDW